ncbi:unnamed protein product [Peronospora belbahrii]|uniref:Dymeclin n=1 Tax=Peronospora belbahrii TaxID=622444 RepID=A0ABN8CQP7_9STRA|nr:unnamed protein product [Peronospora belbahrii]
MGASTSSLTAVAQIFASGQEQAAFQKIIDKIPIPYDNIVYDTVLSSITSLPQLSQTQVELLTREHGDTLVQNNLQSRNFCVLVRYVIYELSFCCRVAKMMENSLDAFDPEAASLKVGDGTLQVVKTHVHRAVNALFLARQFTMRFIERMDEYSLLSHFQYHALTESNGTSTTLKHSFSIQMEAETASSNDVCAPEDFSDDLALPLLDALLTVLIELPPNETTYDLHMEIVNLLLVLLSPVVYSCDYTKQASDLHLHNPFLRMLMMSASPCGKKSYWASGVIRRLLQNSIDQLQATGSSSMTNTAVIALEKAREMSLVAMSVLSNQKHEQEQFPHFTLESVGSTAASIFRYPLSFIRSMTSREDTPSPLADRSVLLLLVLLQSCRDNDSMVTSNPFRGALCRIIDGAGIIESSQAEMKDLRPRLMQHHGTSQSSGAQKLKLLISNVFKVIGSHAPYEASHLMLYTLLYTNPMVWDRAVSSADMERLLLPLLEILHHARSVEPSRLYMLVVVLLTFTQNPTFVHNTHTQLIVPKVPWYQEHYMVDVSLGSLMMIIFTRLIIRNITHFQDNFIHLNAFAALSNLARSAESLHMYAAQGIVGVIDMLAKNEAKLVVRMKGLKATDEDEYNALAQKRSAYVEFIRLLLDVVSSCLKPMLLPRNPQLIYSLLHRADTFATLQQYSEFAAHVHNSPVWITLAQFETVVKAKTSPDDILNADMILKIIRSECTSLLAASSTRSRARGSTKSRTSVDGDDTSYRYEEESNPEQFFVPYIWKHIQEQTPDFCWKVNKITLFVPSDISTSKL